MKQIWLILTIGFAIFSMFFGSGNLVFPILLGQESTSNYFMAALGISLTGVIVPFLGVLGMVLYGGDFQAFFSLLGQRGTFLFSFLALGLLGPFGVVARCLTVSHGALMLIFPELSLPLCSFILSVLIFALAVKKSRIVGLFGNILTPFLLLSLAAIAILGLREGEITQIGEIDQWGALKNGIFQGYQIMDLLAAFFISQFVISHLRTLLAARGEERQMLPVFIKGSLVGMGLLAIIYFVLVALGAAYAPMLAGVPPQEMLGLIALQALGPYAAPCVCIAIVFACVPTAIVLATFFADFLHAEVCQKKLGPMPALLITVAIGFGVSTLDFNGIAAILGPIVEMIYPALIVLTVVNIGLKFYQSRATASIDA